jgi:hypothetical protein
MEEVTSLRVTEQYYLQKPFTASNSLAPVDRSLVYPVVTAAASTISLRFNRRNVMLIRRKPASTKHPILTTCQLHSSGTQIQQNSLLSQAGELFGR